MSVKLKCATYQVTYVMEPHLSSIQFIYVTSPKQKIDKKRLKQETQHKAQAHLQSKAHSYTHHTHIISHALTR